MAVKVKQPSPQEIQTYGYEEGYSQLQYDMWAFADCLPPDQGVPPRLDLFRRIADTICPGLFEWHSWTNMFVEAVLTQSLSGHTGCSNCVAGETRILDPLTGKSPTIKDLCDSGTAPIVMTLFGPEKAGVPFVKGIDQLYEVTLSDGNRFEATAGHYVLTPHGFVELRECKQGSILCSSGHISSASLPVSSLELGLSMSRPSAHHCWKRSQDYLERYSTCCRPCGEQPLKDQGFGQASAPSQAGVPIRIPGGSCGDGPASTHTRIPALFSAGHPSSLGACIRRSSLDTFAAPHDNPERTSRGARSFRPPWRYRLERRCPPPFSRQAPCSDHRPTISSAPSHISVASPTRVALTQIVSIRKTRVATFYDLTVPKAHHYFAEGAIHHNSAKTYNSSALACLWWLMAPERSSVMFVSTSMKMLRKRAWANISRVYSGLSENRYGNFVDSQVMWQCQRGDDLHAIFGKAVEEGSVTAVADGIKGIHTERQMIILDEATAIPPAIWDAVSNLYSYPSEFVLIVMGNMRSRMDTFGRWCEPKDGWMSVSVDHDEWEGKPQPEYGGRVPWICHYDAERSPNIIEGKVVSRHLPQAARVAAAKENAGNSPLYWSNMRGYPPMEGLSKTVFTETGIAQHDGTGQHIWVSPQLTIFASLDPAFGGNDNAILTFAAMGQIGGSVEQPVYGVQLYPPVRIPINAESKETVHYQIADEVIRRCETFKINGELHACPIENLACDATGEGGGLCSIIERKTGRSMIWIEYAGAASEDAVNLEDGRRARDVWHNKRVEIWFRANDMMLSGQLKGISPEAAKEITTMRFIDEKKLVVLMKKKDYKVEFGASPDYGDSMCGISEVARLRGFRLAPVEKTVQRYDDFHKQVKATQEVYSDTYAEEELGYEQVGY